MNPFVGFPELVARCVRQILRTYLGVRLMATTNGAGSGYTVTTADLHDHATSLDRIATTLNQAVSAAQQVTLADDAYGHLPESILFAGLVRLVSQPGLDALNQAQTTLNAVAKGVHQTATNYETTEQANTTTLRGHGR